MKKQFSRASENSFNFYNAETTYSPDTLEQLQQESNPNSLLSHFNFFYNKFNEKSTHQLPESDCLPESLDFQDLSLFRSLKFSSNLSFQQ